MQDISKLRLLLMLNLGQQKGYVIHSWLNEAMELKARIIEYRITSDFSIFTLEFLGKYDAGYFIAKSVDLKGFNNDKISQLTVKPLSYIQDEYE